MAESVELSDRKTLSLMNAAFGKTGGKVVGFDNKGISTEDAYVAWVDIMGAGSAMRRSLQESSSAIGRFHTAIINAYHAIVDESEANNEVNVHSLTDGAYIVTRSPQRMREVLSQMMLQLVRTFLSSSAKNKFVVRSAVAHGNVVSSATMKRRILTGNGHGEDADLVRNVTLGSPFEKAYHGETMAPPFGVFVDQSAIGADNFSSDCIWRWWSVENVLHKEFCGGLNACIANYFENVKNGYYKYFVLAEKIAEYQAKAASYYIG